MDKFDKLLLYEDLVERFIEGEISCQVFILQWLNSKLSSIDLSDYFIIESIDEGKQSLLFPCDFTPFIDIQRQTHFLDRSITNAIQYLFKIESLSIFHGTFIDNFIKR